MPRPIRLVPLNKAYHIYYITYAKKCQQLFSNAPVKEIVIFICFSVYSNGVPEFNSVIFLDVQRSRRAYFYTLRSGNRSYSVHEFSCFCELATIAGGLGQIP